MSLTVGEVEAVFSARDEMSAVADKCAVSADHLTASLQQVEAQSTATQSKTDAFFARLDGGSAVVAQSAEGLGTLSVSAAEVATALEEIQLGGVRGDLNDLAASAGLTVEGLGAIEAAGLVVGAGIAGWKIGRAIADFTGLDDTIARATATLLGFGNATAEAAGAKADVLAAASEHIGHSVTNYSEAIEINTEWQQRWQAAAIAASNALAQANAPAESSKAIIAWNNELDTVYRAGVIKQLTADLDTHLFSLAELAKRYGVSTGALALFQQQLKAADDDQKSFDAYVKQVAKQAEDDAKARAARQQEADTLAVASFERRIAQLKALQVAGSQDFGYPEQIARLHTLDLAEQALAKSVYGSLTSEKDRAKVVEESVTRHITLMNDEAAVQLKQAALVNAAIVAEFEAQVSLNAEWGLTASGAIALQQTAADKLRSSLDALHATKVDGISQAKQEQLLLDGYTKSLYDDAVAEDRRQAATQGANDVLADTSRIADASSTRVVEGTVRMTQAMSDALTMAAKLAVAIDQFGRVTVTNAQGGSGTVGAGGVITWTPPTTGIFTTPPARAGGGPVAADTPYLVGELGPELFVPGAAGSIVPNGGGGGSLAPAGGALSITNHFHIVDTESNLARRVSDQIKRTVLQGLKVSA
jgi:hypothetical protein